MTDYTKLIEALRCELHGVPCNDENCEWLWHGGGCCDEVRLMVDAADAIEALQAEVDTLKRTDIKRCQECLYLGQPVGEQLLPKRGKWVREMNVYDEPFYHCSACGECFDSNRDDTYGIFNYCPNCGAKMEVQDDSCERPN